MIMDEYEGWMDFKQLCYISEEVFKEEIEKGSCYFKPAHLYH